MYRLNDAQQRVVSEATAVAVANTARATAARQRKNRVRFVGAVIT